MPGSRDRRSNIRSARPTLRDVADAAGVSVSTVSRALADNPAVAKATRGQIQKLAADLGYRPNAQARALQSSRTNIIGVVVPSLINHYFASMVTAVQQAAAEARMTTIIVNSGEDANALSEALDVLTDHRVDGIICVPQDECADKIARLYEAGQAIVLIDRELEGVDVPTITSDAEPGMYEAVRQLKKIGALPIGYLSGPMESSTGRNRLGTFRAATSALQLGEQPVYLGGYEQEKGRAGAEELLDQGVKALFAGDSMMTIGVIEACHRRGLEIGRDVAVVGFDAHPVFELQPRPITVIDQLVDEMAVRAFGALQASISGHPPNPLRGYTTTHLISRQSTQEPLTAGGE